MKTVTAKLCAAVVSCLLAACGGGNSQQDPFVLSRSHPAVASSEPLAAMAAPNVRLASVARTPDATSLFDWAERTYPALFEGPQSNQSFDVWTYRYYPRTDIFLALSTYGDVLGLVGKGGGVYNSLALGSIASFACEVYPSDCAGNPPLGALTQIVKIGHAAPMSGPQAFYGRDNANGSRMAVEDLNAQKLVIGGKAITFELVAQDDAANSAQAISVAQSMCDAGVAGVVGHLNSGTSIPAARIYNACGIPHITGSATNPNLTALGYNTSFRVIANDSALGAGLAVYASQTMKLRTVAIVDDRTAYGQGVATAFKNSAIEKGLQIVDEQFTTDRASDFKSILAAIQAKNPDAIFYGGMDAQAGAMLLQMDRLGMSNVNFLGGDGICTTGIVKIAAGARTLERVVCAEGGTLIGKMPGGSAWKARYDAKYPGQFQIFSPYTYDASFVLVDAMKRAESTDPKVYLPKLAETHFNGVTGLIAFESNGELTNPPMTLYTYRLGRKVTLN